MIDTAASISVSYSDSLPWSSYELGAQFLQELRVGQFGAQPALAFTQSVVAAAALNQLGGLAGEKVEEVQAALGQGARRRPASGQHANGAALPCNQWRGLEERRVNHRGVRACERNQPVAVLT